ncbi:hypothetical protein J6S35_02700 [Candidatus Saccharibacteria bacterium]|nr:hypothetical protein [Candidatus Saccharibacteria bacterium]
MLRNNKSSAFNEKEDFSYDSTPKHFNSVTERYIRKIRKKCLSAISRKYAKDNYPASAEKAMLQSIYGEFDSAYRILEGDYSSRYTNLKTAYNNGVADVSFRLMNLEESIATHNIAFSEFKKAMSKISSEEYPDLSYKKEELERLKKAVAELKKEASKK